MNTRCWVVCLFVILMCSIACAQRQPPASAAPSASEPASAAVRARPPQAAQKPAPAPAARAASPPEAAQGAVPSGRGHSDEDAPMPMDRIERPTLLDTQIEAIRAAVPGFNAVILRSSGVAPNYPTLPPMQLKNVTIGQFMRFVQEAFPPVDVSPVDGPNGTLYAIRVQGDDEAERRSKMAEQANRVRLFRLTDIVRAMAAEMPGRGSASTRPEEERIKEATNHVLSLLQIAIEQADAGAPYSLKIHEPTLTLLFKGSAEQKAVLEDALATLDPRSPAGGTRSSYEPGQPRANGTNSAQGTSSERGQGRANGTGSADRN
jgi:hypothetical protein